MAPIARPVPPLLSCRNLTKRFGALTAVKDFSLDLQAGETLGIGGPNGAGKTTLFDVISGLTPASGGAARSTAGTSPGFRPTASVTRGCCARSSSMPASTA